MVNSTWVRAILVAALAPLVLGAATAYAQATGSKDKGAKIVCWKDKSGKVVGCGDRVPPEYQSSATKELDQRGVTRKTTESAEEAAKRQARDKELAAQKVADEKRLAEQKRQDNALLNSYTTAAEIDQRRDRDLQPLNQQISQYQAALKTAPAANKAKYEQSLAAKEKEKDEVMKKYAAQKQRFMELKGEASGAAAAPGPATTAAPAPAPAKK
jgi:hypothetical protein